jgi:hypothetical protein
LNLVALNEVEQTFTCTGYLTETWTDSRLNPVPDGNRVRYYQKNAIWFPLLQFDNQRRLARSVLVCCMETLMER